MLKEGSLKLFMVLLGSAPEGRHTEQHDIFFGIGNKLADLKDEMLNFWPEAGKTLHIDAWREVNFVGNYEVLIVPRTADKNAHTNTKLFFINLGGYKQNEFDEFHYKMIVAAPDKGSAIQQSKQTAFYKHTGFKGAESHIDDKFGIDVDDAHQIEDILPETIRKKYQIITVLNEKGNIDAINLGYIIFDRL